MTIKIFYILMSNSLEVLEIDDQLLTDQHFIGKIRDKNY